MLTVPVLFLAVISVLTNITPCAAAPNYWFSFGDSYTQTGFDPNGALPSASNPIGNPAFPGWSATGGVNWIGASTATFNQSQIFTYNYAYGGATIDAKLVPPYTPTVLSLTDQVNQFLNGAGKKPASTSWTSANSLFSIWIGVNDIGNSYYQSGDRAAFSDTLINAEFALVEKLVRPSYNVGARNFLFLNVPAIYRSPLMLNQAQSARDTEKNVIKTHNQKYATKIAAFKSSHSGVTTWTWDADSLFNKVLDSPTTYGFKDATSYGQTGSFWGNDYHPGSAANVVFARDIDQVLKGTVW